jgi:hypothetical protein
MAIGTFYLVSILARDLKTLLPSPFLLRVVCSLIAICSALLSIATFALNKTVSSMYLALILSCIFFTVGVSDNLAHPYNDPFPFIGGYFGLLAAVISIWLSFVELINAVFCGGNELIPLGQWKVSIDKTTFVNQRHVSDTARRTPQEYDDENEMNRMFFPTQSKTSEEEITFADADVENTMNNPRNDTQDSQERQARTSATNTTIRLDTTQDRNDNICVPSVDTTIDAMVSDNASRHATQLSTTSSLSSRLKDAVSSYVDYSSVFPSSPATKRMSGSPRRTASSPRSYYYDNKSKSRLPETTIIFPQRLPLAPNLTETETALSVSSPTSSTSDANECVAVSLTSKPNWIMKL